MTNPSPKRAFSATPHQTGRRPLLNHLRQHGLEAPGHLPVSPPRYDPPRTSKQDPQ